MKQLISLALGFTMMLLSAQEVQAQGFLKNMANKAKSAVKQGVESVVKNKPASKQAETASDATMVAIGEVESFAESLAAPEEYGSLHRVYNDVAYHVPDLPEDKMFGSLKEAISSFPTQPTLEQVVNHDASWAKVMSDYSAMSRNLMMDTSARFSKAVQSGNAKASASMPKVTDAQKKAIQQNAMKIFQLMQKHGIDPENTSDKDMEAFVMKMVASGELKLPGMPQNMKFEAEDKEDKSYDAITSKVESLEEKMMNLTLQNGLAQSDPFGLNSTLDALYTQLQPSWVGSDAAKKVNEIQKGLDKRLDEFFTQHPTYGQNESERYYPAFWTEGKKQENAIINEFNKGILDKWTAPILKAINDNMPFVKEIETLDAEVEATFADKTSADYLLLKNKLTASFHTCALYFQSALQMIYNAPVVSNVVEQQEIVQ